MSTCETFPTPPARRPQALRAEVLRIREARPDDLAEALSLLRALPAQTRHRRFHTGVHGVEQRFLERLFAQASPTRGALVMVRERRSGQSTVGLAQYAREREGVAEVALAVAEPWRRQGLGALLLRSLAVVAGRHHTRLVAYVSPDDAPGLRLLAQVAESPRQGAWGETVCVEWRADATARPPAVSSLHG